MVPGSRLRLSARKIAINKADIVPCPHGADLTYSVVIISVSKQAFHRCFVIQDCHLISYSYIHTANITEYL